MISPVGARLANHRNGRPHALHPPLGVREGAIFLSEGTGGQHHIGERGRLVKEDVLDDEEVERLDGHGGVVEVGLTEEGVLAHDVHGPDLARQDAFDHVGRLEARLRGGRGAPGALERGQVRFIEALVAGQRVGNAA